MSSPAEPRRIHLFRPQNQLGDLLLNVPAIRAVRERFPRAHLTLTVGRQNAAAVLGQPWADEVRVADTRSFLGVVLRESVRLSPRPDLAIYFTTVSYSGTGAYLVARSGARELIGFDPVRYAARDRAGLTRRVLYPEGKIHQSEVSLALARAAGAGAAPPPPYYRPDPSLLSRAPAGALYLHPGAGKLKNRWPAERFGEVAAELLRLGRDVRLIEGPQDAGTAGLVIECVRRPMPVVRGESIPMLAARFARAALYVGNDTGPLHLAGAVGCPTIGLYGWSDPEEWMPVGSRVRALRAADAMLESIPVPQVVDAALAMMEESA